MTAYACREHPDEPVTWRGTGCAECLAEREQRRAFGVRRGAGREVDERRPAWWREGDLL